MGKVGKISVIPKEFGDTAMPTMEKSLRQRGHSRAPGTVAMRYPYKEASGKYRTGLDENSKRIQSMPPGDEKNAEIERIRALRKQLEFETGLDLSPKSSYYNHNSKDDYRVGPVALRDGDNTFNLNDAWQHITWLWVCELPDIAKSLTAYYAGKYPPDTQFYVNDEDVESEIVYKKKKALNSTIVKFDSFSLDKQKKIARLLDLPVGDSDKSETIYNRVDDFLKRSTIAAGIHKGRDPITVFTVYANLDNEAIDVRNLIAIAFNEQIYRTRENGRVYEGELEVFESRDQLLQFLMNVNNQRERLQLEEKINSRKLQHVV